MNRINITDTYPNFNSRLRWHADQDRPPFSIDEAPIWGMLVNERYATDLTRAVRSYHARRPDVEPWEIHAIGYAPGGLPYQHVRWEPDGRFWRLHADDLVWHDATICARAVIIYRRFSVFSGDSRDDVLVSVLDFGFTICSDRGEFSINHNDGGLIAT